MQTDAEERADSACPVERAEALFFLGDVIVDMRLLDHLLRQQRQKPGPVDLVILLFLSLGTATATAVAPACLPVGIKV